MAGAIQLQGAIAVMGYVWLALIGAIVFAGLARFGIARPLWSFIGAALMLGAAGYAWQGSPSLGGHPIKADAAAIEVDPGIIDLRDRMVGRFTGDAAYLIAADAMTRSGDARAAVQVILGGIRAVPESLALWTGLGSAYATHDGDTVSPASLFAFQQAMRLSPNHPAPPFFLGLAYVKAGQFEQADRWWRRALVLTPEKASYRRDIAIRLALLERYLALRAEAERAAAVR